MTLTSISGCGTPASPGHLTRCQSTAATSVITSLREDEETERCHGYQRNLLNLSTRPKNRTTVGVSIHMSEPSCHDGPAWPCIEISEQKRPLGKGAASLHTRRGLLALMAIMAHFFGKPSPKTASPANERAYRTSCRQKNPNPPPKMIK
jgi:hypothetical protein